MICVEWQNGRLPGKVHFALRLVKTYCGKQIPERAKETTKPRDKSKLCKKCLDVETDQERYRHLLS
jgi:hypothetical protein